MATLPRAVRRKILVSRQVFEEKVNEWAYQGWRTSEREGRSRDWLAAHREFASPQNDPIREGDPRHVKVKARAQEIYEARKWQDKNRQWLLAEHALNQHYEVRD